MAERQPTWDNVVVGQELPPLPKVATTQALVQFAGASGDFAPHHFDSKLAEAWFPGTGVIVHGALKAAWLGQYLTQWAGPQGRLRQLSTQDRGMDAPRHMLNAHQAEEGQTWRCMGTVVAKRIEGELALVDLVVWVENGAGERTTRGEATVALPGGAMS